MKLVTKEGFMKMLKKGIATKVDNWCNEDYEGSMKSYTTEAKKKIAAAQVLRFLKESWEISTPQDVAHFWNEHRKERTGEMIDFFSKDFTPEEREILNEVI